MEKADSNNEYNIIRTGKRNIWYTFYIVMQ